MNPRQPHLILSSLLLLAVLAACATKPRQHTIRKHWQPGCRDIPASQPSCRDIPARQCARQRRLQQCLFSDFIRDQLVLLQHRQPFGRLFLYLDGSRSERYKVLPPTINIVRALTQPSNGTGQSGNLAALDAGSNSLSFTTSKVTNGQQFRHCRRL